MAIDRPLLRRRPAAALLRLRVREYAIAAPAALLGLCVLSVLARVWLARKIAAPWILVDELLYADMAKSFARGGHFLVRGHTTGSWSLAYPALIAPAWRAHSMQTTYAVAKAINAVVMTAAAVPLYLWARRLVTPAYALLAVALMLLMPAYVYTGMLMTENAFLPAFVLAAFAAALALERPTLLRQLAALAALALVCAVRAQGLVLVLVLPTAILLKLVLDVRSADAVEWRTARARLLRFWPTAAGLVLAGVAYVLLQTSRGQPLSAALGPYATVTHSGYSVGAAARWVLFHFAELTLSVAVIPLSALIVLLGLALVRRSAGEAERALIAIVAAATFWVVVEVGTFASRFSLRVEERNMFVVAPLLLLALVVWVARGLPRPPRLTAVAAVVPAALLLTLPLESLLNVSIISDTFGLIPPYRLSQLLAGGFNDVRLLLGAGALAAALLFAAAPRLLGVGIAAAVGAFFVLSTYAVHGAVRDLAFGERYVRGGGAHPAWVDDRVGHDGKVAFLYTGGLDQHEIWQTEFWNRSFGEVYNVDNASPEPSGLAEVPVSTDAATGAIASAASVRYVVADQSVALVGARVASQPPLTLYRVHPPLRLASATEGVYPDGWMGADAAYTQYSKAFRGGAILRLRIGLTAWSGPPVQGHARIEVGDVATGSDGRPHMRHVLLSRRLTLNTRRDRVVTLPMPPPPFRVEIHASPTFSPSTYGQADTRQLGARVAFSLRPRHR